MAGHNLKPVVIELVLERYREIPRRSYGPSLTDQPARACASCAFTSATYANENFDSSYILFAVQGPAMLANSPGSQAAPGDGNAANPVWFPDLSQDSSPLYADRCCRPHDILSLMLFVIDIKLKKNTLRGPELTPNAGQHMILWCQKQPEWTKKPYGNSQETKVR
ncbi:hypothetical protein DYI21_01625 [Thalassospira tepidiphila]|nr:hypothetical protein [Thalassospira tepidiphila]